MVSKAAVAPNDYPVLSYTPVLMGYYTVGYTVYASGKIELDVYVPGTVMPEVITYQPTVPGSTVAADLVALAAGVLLGNLPSQQ